jgi:hypothetical protein
MNVFDIGARLWPGQRFSRQRFFKPAEHGRNKWWLVGVLESPLIDAKTSGTEFIEIIDIAHGATGALAVYRQWIVDPDGDEVTVRWAPKREEKRMRYERNLRSSLAAMHFCEGSGRQPPLCVD